MVEIPFKSDVQRRYMWARHPKIAKRWAHETPKKKKKPNPRMRAIQRRMVNRK